MNMMKKTQQGFTLIELMIVIAIIGILAAVALPAYQDYTVRAKLAEPMALLGEAKTTITEYYVSQGEAPADLGVAGLESDINTKIVASLKYATNTVGSATLPVVYAWMKEGIIPGGGSDDSFELSAYLGSSGNKLQWVCKSSGGSGTAINNKYLPANCRT